VINLFEEARERAFKRQLETTGFNHWLICIRNCVPIMAVASRATIEQSFTDFVLFVEPVLETRANQDQSIPTISVDYIAQEHPAIV